jgi:hypothetical protein
MDAFSLSVDEIFDIMSVLKQDIKGRPSMTTPHKIMVWFSEAANKHLKSGTPKGSYCVMVRPIAVCSEKCQEFVEKLWDRGLVTIEIVRNDGSCAYFSLPRDDVIARNIEKVTIRAAGEDPDNRNPSQIFVKVPMKLTLVK